MVMGMIVFRDMYMLRMSVLWVLMGMDMIMPMLKREIPIRPSQGGYE